MSCTVLNMLCILIYFNLNNKYEGYVTIFPHVTRVQSKRLNIQSKIQRVCQLFFNNKTKDSESDLFRRSLN